MNFSFFIVLGLGLKCFSGPLRNSHMSIERERVCVTPTNTGFTGLSDWWVNPVLLRIGAKMCNVFY